MNETQAETGANKPKIAQEEKQEPVSRDPQRANNIRIAAGRRITIVCSESESALQKLSAEMPDYKDEKLRLPC